MAATMANGKAERTKELAAATEDVLRGLQFRKGLLESPNRDKSEKVVSAAKEALTRDGSLGESRIVRLLRDLLDLAYCDGSLLPVFERIFRAVASWDEGDVRKLAMQGVSQAEAYMRPSF
jgi:hypothetical protein